MLGAKSIPFHLPMKRTLHPATPPVTHSPPTNSRRKFLQQSVTAAAGASLAWGAMTKVSAAAASTANSRIRMGFIGVGNRGSQLLASFMQQPDTDIVALADVYEPYRRRDRSLVHPRYLRELGGRVPMMGEKFRQPMETHRDFRELLARGDIDAVCIATPDHWHAIQTIQAIAAGKDVYVEKPLSITLAEGRAMVQAAAASDRIVQVGLNRRGSTIYRRLVPEVHGGSLGTICVARACRVSNMYPHGIGKTHPEDPPPGLDWDLWLGPRAYRPYRYNLAPYKFRWWKDFSSQMANWGVHYMDACRWFMGETAPVAVSAHGGKVALEDDRDIPDTMEVNFEFASGAVIHFAVHEACGGSLLEQGEIELRGTHGNLACDANEFAYSATGGGQFQNRNGLIKNREFQLENREDPTDPLIRNFLDCVHSRRKDELWCDLETGHRSTSFAHLANIALATRTRIAWDAENESITNHPEANQLLHYSYRSPWTL